MRRATTRSACGPAVVLAGLLALGGIGAPRAQTAPATAAQITETRIADANLIRRYAWKSRVELVERGAVVDARVDLVRFGPDGLLQRTLADSIVAPAPVGLLTRIFSDTPAPEDEVALQLAGLVALLDRYTLPTTYAITDFMYQATATGPDARGQVEIAGKQVVVPDDAIAIWADAATRRTRRMQVSTYYKDQPVTLAATYATLPAGLTYVADAEVTLAQRQLTLRVHNDDFHPR